MNSSSSSDSEDKTPRLNFFKLDDVPSEIKGFSNSRLTKAKDIDEMIHDVKSVAHDPKLRGSAFHALAGRMLKGNAKGLFPFLDPKESPRTSIYPILLEINRVIGMLALMGYELLSVESPISTGEVPDWSFINRERMTICIPELKTGKSTKPLYHEKLAKYVCAIKRANPQYKVFGIFIYPECQAFLPIGYCARPKNDYDILPSVVYNNINNLYLYDPQPDDVHAEHLLIGKNTLYYKSYWEEADLSRNKTLESLNSEPLSETALGRSVFESTKTKYQNPHESAALLSAIGIKVLEGAVLSEALGRGFLLVNKRTKTVCFLYPCQPILYGYDDHVECYFQCLQLQSRFANYKIEGYIVLNDNRVIPPGYGLIDKAVCKRNEIPGNLLRLYHNTVFFGSNANRTNDQFFQETKFKLDKSVVSAAEKKLTSLVNNDIESLTTRISEITLEKNVPKPVEERKVSMSETTQKTTVINDYLKSSRIQDTNNLDSDIHSHYHQIIDLLVKKHETQLKKIEQSLSQTYDFVWTVNDAIQTDGDGPVTRKPEKKSSRVLSTFQKIENLFDSIKDIESELEPYLPSK